MAYQEQQVSDELVGAVANALDRGTSRSEMVAMIQATDASFTKEDAENLIREVMYLNAEVEEESQMSIGKFISGAIGALIGAAIAGFIWYLIVRLTGFEIGYMALGVGILTGLGAIIGGRGALGLGIQLLAAGAAVVGILWAKYMYFGPKIHEYLVQELGPEVAATVRLFDQDRWDTFWTMLGDTWGGYDFIWVALAVYAAFAISNIGHEKG